MQYNADPAGLEPTIPVVFSRADGDVEIAWMRGDCQTEVRRFRSHLGHVVEVLGPEQRLRRIGPCLRGAGSLRVDAELPVVLERALMAAAAANSDKAVPAAESKNTTPDPSPGCSPAKVWSLQKWLQGWLHPLTSRETAGMVGAMLAGTAAGACGAIRAGGAGGAVRAGGAGGALGASAAVRATGAPGASTAVNASCVASGASDTCSAATEEIEMLLHYPAGSGQVSIARCGQGGCCVVWDSQIVGCFPEIQAAIDQAADSVAARPFDGAHSLPVKLSTAIAEWQPFPPRTRIEATRLGPFAT